MIIAIACITSSIVTLAAYSLVLAAGRGPDRVRELGEEIGELKAENFRLRERILALGGDVDE